jgi:hypothetical protein
MVSTARDRACWAECGPKDMEEVGSCRPIRLLGGPAQGVGVMGVGQDVSVEHVDKLAVLVLGELPVSGAFGLGVVHGPKTDPVVAGVCADPARILSAPVGQGIGL